MYVHRRRTRIEIWTPAKLNLYLEVLDRRPDGFHEIETLMVPVSLYDTLRLTLRHDGLLELSARWDLGCRAGLSREELQVRWGDLPNGPENLVVRALELLRRRATEASANRCNGLTEKLATDEGQNDWGMSIELIKRIPAAAGLGGGSSDAAAALVGANQLWNLNWPVERLAELSAELGSDIPFFFAGQPAMAAGRGERVENWPTTGRLHVVLVRPPGGLATGPVYRETHLDKSPRTIGDFRQAWMSGQASQIAPQMFNRLQDAGSRLSPDVGRLRDEFEKLDVLGHQMSGSGSCYFGVCRNACHARRVAGVLRTRRVGRVFRAVTRSTPHLAG